ncbi:MAG: flagellar protein FlgN [Nitrosomonadales bacterium]|nr:flagellar protein FlgN [Nitrosomonadales bacterium]
MGKNTAVAGFSTHLNTERDALKAFITLLEAEQQALVNGKIEQLLGLVDNKIQSAQELNKLELVRQGILRALEAPAEPNDIEAWLGDHARDSLPAWLDTQRLAAQAKEINRANGMLIQTRLRNNQQALTTLHNAANSASGLYGPDGQPHIPSSGRTLGSV